MKIENETVNRIFLAVVAKGLQEKDFAEQIGVKPSALSDWKSGKTKSYRSILPKIAKVLDVSYPYLLCETDNPSREPAEIDENEIRFALYEGEKALLTDSDEEEIKNFVRFVVDKRKKENGDK